MDMSYPMKGMRRIKKRTRFAVMMIVIPVPRCTGSSQNMTEGGMLEKRLPALLMKSGTGIADNKAVRACNSSLNNLSGSQIKRAFSADQIA